MKIFNPEENKPEIIYPCLWQYKVIGKEELLVRKAIKEVCAPSPVEISYSNKSSSGKYCSFNVELEVANEEERNNIFAALKNHSNVSMVI